MKKSDIGKEVIKKELPVIPKLPGVYRMLNEKNEILYVGKAKNLPNRLKSNELQKVLFSYINGGLVLPKFLIHKKYIDENKNIKIDFVNLDENYKKVFSSKEIDDFIKSNKEKLKKKKNLLTLKSQ